MLYENPTVREMTEYLLARGWKRRRKAPKEPWFYLDPTGCETRSLRVVDAYALQRKRDKHARPRPMLKRNDLR